MEAAYDHIQEEVLQPEDRAAQQSEEQEQGNLNTEIQEVYKSFTASPWGAKLGGFWGSVRKQSESYYQGARQEASIAGGEALKGFTDLTSTLVSRARSLSLTGPDQAHDAAMTGGEEGGVQSDTSTIKEQADRDALHESESLISRFRAEAAKRLKEIEKAEDAADEALLKFGTNIRNFLRDAVTIAPPTEEKDEDGQSKVLYESKDQDGRRVIHTTRFDAQLHVIHCSSDSLLKDPASPEYEKWKGEFNVEGKTDAIATDLERYEELRRAMEKLVPEKVDYETFWTRYYFLRMVVESEERRRREMLKGAVLAPVEEVAWDEDSDDEPSTPQPRSSTDKGPSSSTPLASKTSTTPRGSEQPSPPDDHPLKPSESRRSQDEKSQADSDTSYDLVSGTTSRGLPSPKEDKEEAKDRVKKGQEESDEEDWE